MLGVLGAVVIILTLGFVIDLIANDGKGAKTIKELFNK